MEEYALATLRVLKRDVIYLFFVLNIRHVFQTRTSSGTYCFRKDSVKLVDTIP